jgi:hypothetical protein
VLFNYPDVGVHYPTLQYLGRCEAELQASREPADAKDDK